MKASEFGLGQAVQLYNMPSKEGLEFIAEGLTVIFESTQSLMGGV
jgi:hypothetical protein